MEHLTPNTRTTPDLGSAQTLPPIQAIFAARFAAKKSGYPHHSPIRKAVGTGLLTSLSQSNKTNPKPAISRSPQAERHQEPDIFSTSLHPQSEQTQTPLAAAYYASPAKDPPDQYAVSGLRPPDRTNPNAPVRDTSQTEKYQKRIVISTSDHSSRTNPSSATGRKLRNPNRRQSRNWPFSQLCAARTEQTQAPKPSSKASGKPGKRTKRSHRQTLKLAVNRPGQWPYHAAHAL